MNFKEATVILGISEYSDRIFNSNSRGELFHIEGYIRLAEIIAKDPESEGMALLRSAFTELFLSCVSQAETKWQRPESVFQHIVPEFTNFLRN